MSNPTGRPPHLLAPPSQWQQAPPSLPVVQPSWPFPPPPSAPPPPMIYPWAYPAAIPPPAIPPPGYPQLAPNAPPWQYPGSQDIPPSIPFTAVPPPMVPNFAPPVGAPPLIPSFQVPSLPEVSPMLPAEPRFPPPNPQSIPPNLGFPTSETSQTGTCLSKDPRKLAKSRSDSLSDETDRQQSLFDSSKKNYTDSERHKVQKDAHSKPTNKSNTSQESKDVLSGHSKEKNSKYSEYSPDKFNKENRGKSSSMKAKEDEHLSDHSSRSRSKISPSRSMSKNSSDHRISSHFRDRSSKSRSPSPRSSSYFRDRSSRSPGHSPNRRASSHLIERSSRSRNSPSREYKDSKHGRDQSSRSSQYNRDFKHDKDRSYDSIDREYEYSRKFHDRSRSRSRLPDKFRDERNHKNGSDRGGNSISKDYRGESKNYPSVKGGKHSCECLDDKQSQRVFHRQANYSGSDSEYERRSKHKKTKTDSKSEISHRSKSSKNKETSSAEEKDQLKKSSPKVKCVDPKLKLYDDIWRKVRGKAKSQMKLGSKKIPVSPEIIDKIKKEPTTGSSEDKGTEKHSEIGASPCPSSSKEKVENDTPKKSPKKLDTKESKIDPDRSLYDPHRKISSKHLRSEKRDRSRERFKENEDQPSLSTEPTKCINSTSAENYYLKVENSKEVLASDALKELHNKFQYELVERGARAKACRPKYDPPQRKIKLRKHKIIEAHSDSKSSSSSSSEESSSEEEDTSLEELERKRRHPDRLHPELWFNDPNEMNDGPLCRCSAKARRSGIRHGIYVGEGHLPACNPQSNNANTLYHYKICVTPVTNFLTKNPTYIRHAGHKYIFEGFSLFSHKPLPKLPNCKVIRFNYEYTLMYVEEAMPTNFTVAGLELFSGFLLKEILELVDLDWRTHGDEGGCPQFHFMPRFARKTGDDTKELLSLNVVMEYLLKANKLLIDEKQLPSMLAYSSGKWQDLADQVKGMIVTCPGMKPSSVRVDQLDREHTESSRDTTFPVIVHFGVRPPQLSYAGNPLYQKAWRDYVKYRHLLANKPKVTYADRHKLTLKESKLQEMRMENDLKRDVTIVISSKGFYQTGMMSDMIQHAMLLPILVCHLRFHASLVNLEDKIGYKFQDRFLLQLALTHPSYRENFGTNPDHARNSLTNCGLRQPQYGDRRIHYMNTRKRGINTLINIMSRFGQEQESASRIHHNERLEFLGDAVVEFLSSIHLFYMFPDLEEGGLATYRAAIVQNQHLAVLSKKLELETFMLYAHGSDLCHDLELRHAMANCFEALMGALFLDAGIEVADKVFSNTLFPEPELKEVWMNYPLHPLQEQEPNGDRRWIESIPLLQKLNKFEEQIGIEFTHIRLLARALTHRSLGYNNLTLGSNQRLEFLGDTVLQLVASEYLYKFFPQHHEGHLSLLRSSLVNNRTQAVVCGDLGMVEYAIYPYFKVELKPKDKADLLEAFLGALYIDKDLGYCRKFCEVCFFPRLQDFIMNQDWNDPKSKLQQCCLTLRSMDGGEPDIPTYKVIECKGPTNTRVYGVAVYFQGNRLAVGEGHSIQQAEMDAASNALRKSKDLFPQLRHQKRAIERSLKHGPPPPKPKEKKRSKHSSTKEREKK